jgi:hypothetical protein
MCVYVCACICAWAGGWKGRRERILEMVYNFVQPHPRRARARACVSVRAGDCILTTAARSGSG